MITTIFKKRITEVQLANIFVNGIFDVIDKGFEDVKLMVQDDPAFFCAPKTEHFKDGHFTMIVLVANIKTLEETFLPKQQSVLKELIFQQLAKVFEMSEQEFEALYKEYAQFMSRVNHPSKVLLYSMSKALFFKYELNDYQEDYFKKMKTPNPLFLKRMDKVMKNFIWNWGAFFKNYKLHID